MPDPKPASPPKPQPPAPRPRQPKDAQGQATHRLRGERTDAGRAAGAQPADKKQR